MSALRSPNRPARRNEPDQVTADSQVEDFVQFWRAGEPAKGIGSAASIAASGSRP